MRSYRMTYLDNWDGKPRLIEQVSGKKPLFAAGNSNSDQRMLQYAALTGGMSVLVHHTDGEREYRYDKHALRVAIPRMPKKLESCAYPKRLVPRGPGWCRTGWPWVWPDRIFCRCPRKNQN